MINKPKNVLWGCMSVIAMSALVSMSKPCMAQMTDAINSPALSPAPTRTSGSSVSAAEETKGTRDSATTQSTPQSGNPQGGISSLSSRVKSFRRNGPTRQSWNTIDLGTKYARAVLGGFEQGASIGLGVQLTTADSIRFVEFRVSALTTRSSTDASKVSLLSSSVWREYSRGRLVRLSQTYER
jgi:hypothetical protein